MLICVYFWLDSTYKKGELFIFFVCDFIEDQQHYFLWVCGLGAKKTKKEREEILLGVFWILLMIKILKYS